ncbi:MAG TPA: lytic transglycosylase domain-containing protein, partial [Thermomicrobiales bacterium]|nr:lytic transglycosylase domain-containing protein [Thermomicrobiales bacterium]
MPINQPAARLLVALVLALSLTSASIAVVAGAPPLRSTGATSQTASTPTPTPTNTPVSTAASIDDADMALVAGEPTPFSSDAGRPKPAPRQTTPTPIPPTATPTPAPTQPPTPTAEPTLVPPPAAVDGTVRLDEPVLRWLPEMVAASNATGTPITIIAGVMRLESSGDPNIVSVAGARGLMQVMPFHFQERGIPESLWHDPATNIMVGASILAGNATGGSWAEAVAAYFGYGCDAYGTCTAQYVQVAFSWAAYYAPVLENLYGSVFAMLPSDWLPPAINPQV